MTESPLSNQMLWLTQEEKAGEDNSVITKKQAVRVLDPISEYFYLISAFMLLMCYFQPYN